MMRLEWCNATIVTHVTHTVPVYQSMTRTETSTAQLAVTNHLQNKIRTDSSANSKVYFLSFYQILKKINNFII